MKIDAPLLLDPMEEAWELPYEEELEGKILCEIDLEHEDVRGWEFRRCILRKCRLCEADLKRAVSGAALDIKLLPSSVNGENGVEAISSLIKGFVTLGGHFMQLDIADTELLKKAQEHPEDYQNLSVRVSGWNARFVTLNKEWQDMIIAQTGSEL